MVEATVQMQDGSSFTTYAGTFEELFQTLEGMEVVKVIGKTIKLSDMRQGKEMLNNAKPV